MKKSNLCTKINTNQTIVVDYLELNFEYELADYQGLHNFTDLNGNTYIEHTSNQSKTFANIDNLYIDNRLIGEIKYNSKITPNKEIVLLKIENSLLYSNNFTDYITYLIEKVGFKLNHIVRLDIAIDCINHKVIDFLNGFIKNRINQTSTINLKGKANLNSLYFNQQSNQYKSFVLGSLKSGKGIKIYDKSKELTTNSKPYVTEFWKINNLNYTDNVVERTELTLLTAKAKHITYTQLTNANYLASICQQEFKNYFEFNKIIKNQHGKTITDVTPIQLTNFETKYLPKEKVIKLNCINIKTIKTTIKTLYLEILSNEYVTKEQYKNLMTQSEINKLIEKYGLQEYYDNKINFWKDEFYFKNHTKIKKEKELNLLIKSII